MCRHLAYMGPGVALSELLHEPAHSLEHQAYAPRELLSGHVNADGFGVAWYPPAEPGPAVRGDPLIPLQYRNEQPVWSDGTWRALAARFVGHVVLANVRNATDPTTNSLVNIHPYTEGRWSFTHNGYLTGFREHFMRTLTGRLSERRYAGRAGATDSETLFLLLLDRLEQGDAPDEALSGLVQESMAIADEVGQPSFLNFLFSDGERVWATRAGTAPKQPSLYVAQDPQRFPGASLVASEPLDEDAAWQKVPEGSLVVLEVDKPPTVKRAFASD